MFNLHDAEVENNVIDIFIHADHVTQNLKIGMKLTSGVIRMPQTTDGVHLNMFIINHHFHKTSGQYFKLQFPSNTLLSN